MKSTWITDYLNKRGKNLETLQRALMGKTKAELTDMGQEMGLALEGLKVDMVSAIMMALRAPESPTEAGQAGRAEDTAQEPLRASEPIVEPETVHEVMELVPEVVEVVTVPEVMTLEVVPASDPDDSVRASGPDAGSIFWRVADRGLDVVYGLLIAWDGFCIRLPGRMARLWGWMVAICWPALICHVQMVLRGSRRAYNAVGALTLATVRLVARWAFVGLLAGVAVGRVAWVTVRAGWRMRAEILAEMSA